MRRLWFSINKEILCHVIPLSNVLNSFLFRINKRTAKQKSISFLNPKSGNSYRHRQCEHSDYRYPYQTFFSQGVSRFNFPWFERSTVAADWYANNERCCQIQSDLYNKLKYSKRSNTSIIYIGDRKRFISQLAQYYLQLFFQIIKPLRTIYRSWVKPSQSFQPLSFTLIFKAQGSLKCILNVYRFEWATKIADIKR